MIGTIPPEISALRHLDVLALGDNCIYGGIPSAFGLMTNLQQLYLQFNGLSGFVPDELSSMTSLTHLDLAWQREYEYNCTSRSGDLIHLKISSDGLVHRLKGRIFEIIKSLRHLREVNILGNNFSGQITPGIKNLKQLGEKRQNASSNLINLYLISLSHAREIIRRI